jgi:hypothetical protein
MEQSRRRRNPLRSLDSGNGVSANESGIHFSWPWVGHQVKKSIPFIACVLLGGLGGFGTFAMTHHSGTGRHPVAVSASTTSDLEITSVQGGPDAVPCKPTVDGQGRVPQGMTAVVYAVDEADHQETHWYEPISNFDDSTTHWWVNISLRGANKHFTVGAIVIPTPLALYLSTAEKWKDPTYTYWGSPGFPPGAAVSENTMTVTRNDQPC